MEYPKDINFKEYEDLDGSKVTTWTNNFHPIEGITEKSVLWKVIEHEGKLKSAATLMSCCLFYLSDVSCLLYMSTTIYIYTHI